MVFPNSIVLQNPDLALAPMTSNPASDEGAQLDCFARSLAAGIARGDENAFRELYDRYHPRLLRFLLVIARGDQLLAQEIAHATLLTAAAKLRKIESERHLWHWLARASRQHLIKHFRKRGQEPVFVTVAEALDTADLESDRILEEQLEAALHALDNIEREMIEAFYFDGLSQNEIAERHATTTKAVSSRLERARAKLRSFINRTLSHET